LASSIQSDHVHLVPPVRPAQHLCLANVTNLVEARIPRRGLRLRV